MLKIVQAPATVLSTRAKEVNTIDKATHVLLKEMVVTLASASDPEGVGLAAPQVGKSLRIFIVKQSPKSPLLTFINPEIIEVFAENTIPEVKEKTKKKGKKNVQLEGCLSLKDIWGVVKRNYALTLSYQDETGAKHTEKFVGFLATIIQHECDHLDGVLFPKRVLEQSNTLYHSIKNSRGETEFQEMEI